MILLIDNYDSFSYNLYQLLGSVKPDIQVVRNDELTVEKVRRRRPEAIVLSPGRGGRKMRESVFLLSRLWQERFPSWGYALAIRLSARHLGEKYLMPES